MVAARFFLPFPDRLNELFTAPDRGGFSLLPSLVCAQRTSAVAIACVGHLALPAHRVVVALSCAVGVGEGVHNWFSLWKACPMWQAAGPHRWRNSDL